MPAHRAVRLGETVGTEVVLTAEAPDAFREELKETVVKLVRTMPMPRVAIPPPGPNAVEYFIPLVTDADGNAYAAIYKPHDAAYEVVYLPDGVEPTSRWVALAFERWSEDDPDLFPQIARWTHREEWMTAAERVAANAVEAARQELAETTERLERDLSDARERLDRQRADVDITERRLLTATGDDLASAVAKALRQVGFEVEDRDAAGGRHKLEDLRVRDGDWVAIAEVKGYAKGGTTKDLLSLGRFSKAFQADTGRFPAAEWYVVNQFRDRDPDTRPQLLRGQDGDVDAFADSDGAVIDTRALFQLSQCAAEGRITSDEARELLKNASGRFEFDRRDTQVDTPTPGE